jgi:hypothetical protein
MNGRDMAFPALDTSYTPNGTIQLGLTKRELFAAMAMQGMLGDPERGGPPVDYAHGAVECADALLTALKDLP